MGISMEELREKRDQEWRKQLRDRLSVKERRELPRLKMPEKAPMDRIRGFMEVNNGLDPEEARDEARRCLDCANPTCVTGCPVNINIPEFIKRVEQGDFARAAQSLKSTNALPAICGRVCPQETQCEEKCIYNKMKKNPDLFMAFRPFPRRRLVHHKGLAARTAGAPHHRIITQMEIP